MKIASIVVWSTFKKMKEIFFEVSNFILLKISHVAPFEIDFLSFQSAQMQ